MLDYSRGAAFLDETVVPISEAKISLLDWGFLHSDATYDVAHVWQGRFFRLDKHIDRFHSSMEALRLSIRYDREALTAILTDLVRKTGFRDAYVEMIATRGLPAPGSRDPRTCTNRFYAFAVPFIWVTKPDQGLHLIISKQQRISAESVDPTVKNYHWLDLVMGQFEAYDRGGETAALVDQHGHLKEGPGFNIFAVKGQTIITPASGILEGVTRRTAIDLAIEHGYKVMQGDLIADDARSAEELFITSTAGGIMPITKIDHQLVGSGETGPVTGQLQDAYWALHEDPRYTLEIDYE